MPFTLTATEAQEIASTLRRRHRDLVWSEDYLLGLIEARKSKMDVYWSVIGLRHCGTLRCIPALKELSNHPTQDIKATAILTIATIAGTAETAYYAERLSDPQYRAKDYAIWAIGVAGDERALAVVHSYIKRNKKSLSQVPLDCTLLQEIVAYFYRVIGPEATAALLAGQYSFIRESLVSSPMMNPHVRLRFFARVPELEAALG